MSKQIEEIFEVDPDLKIREELIGIHAINPFVANDSSARSHMASAHISQILTIEHGDEKIIQTGLENQFGANTFSVKALEDVRILKVIYRYNGISANMVSAKTEVFIIVESLATGELDYINLPYYFSLHQYFGFKYQWRTEILNGLMPGTIIKKDTVFADSPTVADNKGYKFGINANIALWSIPGVGEDGVVISQSAAERLSYKIFETRTVSFGADCFPLNIYGDENTYKAFPEIGEKINDDSVVMVLRDYDPRLSAALTSKKDVRSFNPTFDRAVYVKGPGEDQIINGYKVESGQVVDILAYSSPRFKKNIYTDTANDVIKYVDGYKKYHQDIISVYEDIASEHFRRFKDNVKVSEKFHRLLIDAYAIVNPNNANIAYSMRNEPLDIFNITFKICYNIVINIGAKISDLHGGKGVIVAVVPDEEMPIDIYGNRADIIMDPGAVPSRMNAGRLYEIDFNGTSRHAKAMVKNVLSLNTDVFPAHRSFALPNPNANAIQPLSTYSDAVINNAFDIIVGLTKIVGTEQYNGYLSLTARADKEVIIKDVLDNELFILYKVSSVKKPYQIALEINGSIYEQYIDKIHYPFEGNLIESEEVVQVAPLYTIVLAKTADNYLSCASAKVNHYDLPIGVGNIGKYRLPYRNSPVKNLSETETRLYTAYVSRLAIAELKDRANSITSHEMICRNILNSERPTNIKRIVDRAKQPYGSDAALELIENIFSASGIKIDYAADVNRRHPK